MLLRVLSVVLRDIRVAFAHQSVFVVVLYNLPVNFLICVYVLGC
jgi:hypothetical protein